MTVQKWHRGAVSLLALGIAFFNLAPMSEAAKKEKHSNKKTRQETTTAVSLDTRDAVNAQIIALGKALAAGEVANLVSLWTEDGTYTDEDGIMLKGRSALEKRFTQTFSETGKQPVTFAQNRVQMLADTVALADGIVSRNEGTGVKPQTRYSIVFVKQNGNWLISNATETPLVALNENVNPLNDLSWIIGEWSAERDGKSVRMKAGWTVNNKFIDCKYEAKVSKDAAVIESHQYIGWDPRVNAPVSWHFDSSGGFGHGDWTRENNGWVIKAIGVDREGNTTVATDVLSALAGDSFSWQSVNRSIDGVSFNDSAPLKVVRVAK